MRANRINDLIHQNTKFTANKLPAISNGASYIIQKIESTGVNHVFMIPGKMISPFLQAFDMSRLKAIVPAHEAGAGFMADGYARASGKYGVCLAIAGPGTANLVPSITAAYADQIPILCISGGITYELEGRGAFQDATKSGLNDVALMQPITNYANEVKSATALPQQLHNAYRKMYGSRNSPTYLQISLNTQTEIISEDHCIDIKTIFSKPQYIEQKGLEYIVKTFFVKNKKCALLVGNKVNDKESSQALIKLAETWHIPVATTLEAKGVIPEDHSLSLGVFGYAGNQSANELLLGDELDGLLIIGCDINQRNTMAWDDLLYKNKQIIQIDSDRDTLGKNIPIDFGIVSIPQYAMEYISGLYFKYDNRKPIQSHRNQWYEKYTLHTSKYYESEINEIAASDSLHPRDIINTIRRVMPRDTVTVVDSGAHRAFVGHYWQAFGPKQYLTSSTLAPMGWAIPAAIGAKLANPNQPCLTITGDGCMLMHGIEIQTAARYNVPVIFVVLNNSAHGGIHLDSIQKQAFSSKHTELVSHDWQSFAKSLGVQAYRVKTLDELEQATRVALELNQACLLEVICESNIATPVERFKQAMSKVRK